MIETPRHDRSTSAKLIESQRSPNLRLRLAFRLYGDTLFAARELATTDKASAAMALKLISPILKYLLSEM